MRASSHIENAPASPAHEVLNGSSGVRRANLAAGSANVAQIRHELHRRGANASPVTLNATQNGPVAKHGGSEMGCGNVEMARIQPDACPVDPFVTAVIPTKLLDDANVTRCEPKKDLHGANGPHDCSCITLRNAFMTLREARMTLGAVITGQRGVVIWQRSTRMESRGPLTGTHRATMWRSGRVTGWRDAVTGQVSASTSRCTTCNTGRGAFTARISAHHTHSDVHTTGCARANDRCGAAPSQGTTCSNECDANTISCSVATYRSAVSMCRLARHTGRRALQHDRCGRATWRSHPHTDPFGRAAARRGRAASWGV